MRAMILAAGRGERMRPLTDHCPKPLLPVGGTPLIVWQIRRLVAAGLDEIIINHAWLGQAIVDHLGDGRQYGARLSYSAEPAALETAGGIARALPFFGARPFLVVNADIWCDWPLERAWPIGQKLQSGDLAHLVLVNNPAHHPSGDFILEANGRLTLPATQAPDSPRAHEAIARPGGTALTFAGIGIYHPGLFASVDPSRPAALAPVLRQAISQDAVSGERHQGQWMDIGTPARLADLDHLLRSKIVYP